MSLANASFYSADSLDGQSSADLEGKRRPISNAIRSRDLRRSKIGWSKVLARDAELPHHGVQGGSGEPEPGCCLADHATGLPQHTHDMLPLHACQSVMPGGFEGIRPYLGQRSTEMGAA